MLQLSAFIIPKCALSRLSENRPLTSIITIMYNNIGMIRYVYYLKISRMPLPSDGSLPFGILQRDKNGNRSTAYFKGGNQSDF